MHIATILTNTHSIIKKSMPIAKDFLSVGLSIPKLSLFTACLPPPPVILREAEGEVAESIIQKITLVLRERGDRCRRWVDRGRALSPTPHPLVRAPSLLGEGCISLRETVDSVSPSKPCVQNDISES